MGDRSRAQLLAYGVAAVLLVIVGVRYLEGRGGERAPAAPALALDGAGQSPGGSGGGSAPGGSGGSAPGGEDEGLYVHVAGAVRKEGLFRLPAGARVGAAVDRAGGPLERADLSRVNLAAQVEDGQQVVVPRRGADPAPATAGTAAPAAGAASPGRGPGASGAAPISLASATVEQLDAGVEGIGPTLAARIVEYRDQNGGFGSVDELREVDGIGEARFSALREAVGP